MMRRLLLSVCLVFLAFGAAIAEEDVPMAFEEFPQALGVFFGEAAGMGLSYHRWANGNGMQIAAGVLYSPSAESNFFYGTYLDYTIGLEYQKSVFGEDFINWLSGQLYLWGGLSHRGLIDDVVLVPQEYDEVAETVIQEAEYGPGPYVPSITVGVGIGVEIILFRHFAFPIEVGYAATYNLTSGSIIDGLTVSLIPQGGARYRY